MESGVPAVFVALLKLTFNLIKPKLEATVLKYTQIKSKQSDKQHFLNLLLNYNELNKEMLF